MAGFIKAWVSFLVFFAVQLHAGTHTFSSAGHPKAKGLEVQLQFPADWTAKEGQRPNVVQVFNKKYNGPLSANAVLIIVELPFKSAGLSEAEARTVAEEIFSDPKDLVPEGSTLLSSVKTMYDAEPGVMLFMQTSASRAGLSVFSKAVHHIFIYSNRMVQLQFSVGTLESLAGAEEIVEKEFDRMLPEFQRIALSFVIPEKWKNVGAKVDAAVSSEFSYSGSQTNKATVAESTQARWWQLMESSFLTLMLFSAVISVIVGLLPPLLLRFFIKMPLGKIGATIFVIFFYAFNNAVVFPQEYQHPVHRFMFLLIAIVSFWILTKPGKASKTAEASSPDSKDV